MKRLASFMLILCVLLSACAKAPASDYLPPDDSAPGKTDTDSNVPPDDGIPEETDADSDSVPPNDGAPEDIYIDSDYVPPDYSTHGELYADEEMYITELADLKMLSLGKQAFVWEVEPADWSASMWDGENADIWGYDVRSCNVSGEDFSGIENWNKISFNSDTLWPSADRMPEGFDPAAVLELSKDPGLGIRDLHDQGVTGEGVGIAIIDQGLYTGHEQYRENLMLYESFHASDGQSAAMHGSAVASIAVGRDVGVAPGAKLYYIACDFGHFTDDGYAYDLSILADGIYRVLEINRSLPQGEKIRVISISFGPTPDMPGYQELADAVQAAGEEGIFALTVSPHRFYPEFQFLGMSREGLADPNDPQAYRPAAWLADLQPDWLDDTILVPMGGRTYAGCTGEADYEWSSEGGMSWAVPWLAGFYALCCQAAPDCTVDQFFRAVQATASTKLLHENGYGKYCFGRIIDPAAAIEALKTN